MTSVFERFVALRYLWGAEGRPEGRSFLRFITYVAIGGVALGVAALLLSLAIVRGFGQEITSKIIGFGAHIQVQSYLQDEPLPDAVQLQRDLDALNGVDRVAPVLQGNVLLRRSRSAIDGIVLMGGERLPLYLEGRVVEGSPNIQNTKSSSVPLVVGAALAERLGLDVGQTVTAFSLDPGEGGVPGGLQRPKIKQFTVTGIFETSLTSIDDTYAFTNLRAARDLLDKESGAVSRFDLRVENPARIDSLTTRIENTFGFPISARSIYKIQPYSSLFAWVDLQRSIIPLVIGGIVVVAAFNVVGTLLMIILEKTREIGVLQSLGASQKSLKRLFLGIGLLIGIVGTSLGSVTALTLALLQQRFALIPLPAKAYYMTTAPIKLVPLDFLLVATVSVGLCALASYIPARVAARVEPVRAIRFQ